MYSTCMFTCICCPFKEPHTGATSLLNIKVCTVISYDTQD